MRGQETKLLGVVIVIMLVVFAGFLAIKIVPAGHKGILLEFGAVKGTIEEGLSFVTPFVNSVVITDMRTQKYETAASAASSDLQTVTTTIALNFHIKPDKADILYKSIGKDYRAIVVEPAIEEALKASTSRFTAEELISKREDLKVMTKEELISRLLPYYIEVETVNIVDFKFSDVFDDAIEAKVTAEQRALEAEKKLEQVKFEAQQKVEAARGEAEAIKVINEQLTKSPQYIELLAVQKWDGQLPMATSGLPFLNLPFQTTPSYGTYNLSK